MMSPGLQERSASAIKTTMLSRHKRKHLKYHSEQNGSRDRDELLEFVRRRREQKERALRDLEVEQHDGNATDERFRIRPPTPEVHPEAPTLPEVRAKSARLSHQDVGPCPVCGRDAADGYACRVCGQAFHRRCLLQTAHLPEDELDEQLPRAHTNIGWSCPTCDDISALLTEKELDDMMEDFENYDINKANTPPPPTSEAGITIEDYVAIKRQEYLRKEGQEIGELDLLRVKAQFQCMDINGDGMVDWWEFVKQETCKKIAKRPKGQLVSLLTDLEVAAAHQLFCIFDDDDDGRISEFAVRKAYRAWYGRITASCGTGQSHHLHAKSTARWSLARPQEDTNMIDDPVLNLHVEHHCRIVLGESEDNKCGVITWEGFLMEQALYIICSRPNRALAGNRSISTDTHN